MSRSALPALDAHAHIAPDVTPTQIAALGQSVVFAMTRSLDEARKVKNRRDPALVWGIGVHPGLTNEIIEYMISSIREFVAKRR